MAIGLEHPGLDGRKQMSSYTQEVAQSQFLTFHFAAEEYAVDILRVREIVEYDTITRVPGMPRCITGVLNLRGSVVPVVDLALKFGFPQSTVTNRTCVLIFETTLDDEPAVIGVLADSVSQVLELGADGIEPPPGFGTRIGVDYLIGMGKVDGRFVLILDIEKILTVDELLLANALAV
jgi:purine-binding chemotaxis protein CheW